VDGPTVYVYELGPLKRRLVNYNDTGLREILVQVPSWSDTLPIKNFDQIIGKYYCDKKNNNMYLCDLAALALCVNNTGARNSLHHKLIGALSELKDQILVDEIIWMKNQTPSIGA
jgi:hypothetical protein